MSLSILDHFDRGTVRHSGGTRPVASPVDRDEAQRILDVPRSEGYPDDVERYVLETVQKTGASMHLKRIQLEMLSAIAHTGGMLGMVGVGSGKTLVSLAASLVTPCERPLLLVPSQTVIEKTAAELDDYVDSFHLDARLMIMSFGELSRAQGEDALYALNPDLIVADEAHLLANARSARTSRLRRYVRRHAPRFIAMTGTMTKRSVRDYAHLSEWALGEGSPLPQTWSLLRSWALCTDPPGGHEWPTRADWQTLERLVFDFGDWKEYSTATKKASKRAAAREAIQNRLALTSGVVVSETLSCTQPLRFGFWRPSPSAAIDEAIDELDATWELPNGDYLTRAVEVGAAKKQLSLGFHYYWDWPEGPDYEWLEARAAWHREVRAITKRPRRGIDTPHLIEQDILAGGRLSRVPSLVQAYRDWCRVRDRPEPPTEVAWVDRSRIADALSQAPRECLIWYLDRAVANELERLGVETYRGGQKPPEDGGRSLALSLRAHGKVYNLQAWRHNLFLGSSASAVYLEQGLGRTHRQGQMGAVQALFMDDGGVHRGALQKAIDTATMIEQKTKQPQRLLLGEWQP